MQTVVHVAHHVEPSVIGLGYHILWTASALSGAALLISIVRCCLRK